MLKRARNLLRDAALRARHRTAGDDVDHARPGRPDRGGARDRRRRTRRSPARDQDRKLAYGAAEAGIQNYLFRLQHDLDLWTQCDQISGTKFVNPAWNGSGTDPRVFRTLPGTEAQYTVELLPATGYSQCSTSNPSVVARAERPDPRPLDRPGARDQAQPDRQVPAPQLPRLPLLHRHRVARPRVVHALRQRRADDPGHHAVGLRQLRLVPRRPLEQDATAASGTTRGNVGHNFTQKCGEIQFAAGDALNGPVHTNDEFLICGHPIFGRTIDDSIEVSASSPGWRSACSSSSPTFRGTYNASAPILTMPPTNTQLRDTTDPSYIFTGQTTIVLERQQHDGERHDDGLPDERADLRPERDLRPEPEDVRPVQLAGRLRGRLRHAAATAPR